MTLQRKGARTTFDSIHAQGRTPIGIFQSIGDPAITELIGTAAFDFVLIDGEHSPMGPAEWLPLIRTAEAFDLIPLVRVWDSSRPILQKVLDVGAEGVVIPHMESAQHAADVVAGTRFPAQGGVRSMCPGNHGSSYSMRNFPAFAEHSNKNFLVIPIIESKAGIHNLEEILAVEGIDYVYFGHGDLSVDLGVDMDDPIIATMWNSAKQLAARAGKRLIASDNMPGLEAGDAGAVVCGMESIHLSETLAALRNTTDERLHR